MNHKVVVKEVFFKFNYYWQILGNYGEFEHFSNVMQYKIKYQIEKPLFCNL